ncbi:MAG TPA: ribosome biogenesis GTPase Der [Syntrophorhabdaceae bacterium]|nr:ribosome biogenesis GTPase Der [Syntrophorhabdaceae bacterium]
MKPVISIVGRPNVGKSTLFNRILGYKKAITENIPGVTRDRNYGEFDYRGREFILVDTGGFEPLRQEGFSKLIEQQIRASIDESDIIVLVLDGTAGIMAEDRDVIDSIRKTQKPVFYALNKVDSNKREEDLVDFYELGIQEFYPVSALHGRGVDDLLEDIVSTVQHLSVGPTDRDSENRAINIAFVGKPNTGKSSITNRMLGSERMIVSELPGTTRDSIDSRLLVDGRDVVLIDTAGLRKKSRIEMKVEEYSASSSIRSIERAHVVNLVIDALEGPGHQEGSIAHLIISRGKGICIVVNKWDLVSSSVKTEKYKKMMIEKIPHANFAPVVFASAKTGRNVEHILTQNFKVYEQLNRRISTPEINKAFNEFFDNLSISVQQGKQVKLFYVSQAKTMPPTFILFSNHPELIPEHYKRYLENSIRKKFGFGGAPLRLVFKKK